MPYPHHHNLVVCRFPQGASWEEAQHSLDVLHLRPDEVVSNPKLVIYGAAALQAASIDELVEAIAAYNNTFPSPTPRQVRNIKTTMVDRDKETIRLEFHPAHNPPSERQVLPTLAPRIRREKSFNDAMTVARRTDLHGVAEFGQVISQIGEIEFGPLQLIKETPDSYKSPADDMNTPILSHQHSVDITTPPSPLTIARHVRQTPYSHVRTDAHQ